MSNRQPLALYVHIPFCVRKCLYCDFLSAPAEYDVQRKYIEKLEWELASAARVYEGYIVKSIFFGGGTPSVLFGEDVAELLGCIKDAYKLAADAEITIEANPGTFTSDKLRSWLHAGVNRLSMGVQSLNDSELTRLGRIHSADEARRAYVMARKAGFENINVDLIFGLPGQSVSDWSRSLDETIAMGPEHISAYSLIIEEGTPFYASYHAADLKRAAGREQSILPAEEEEREMAGLACVKLAEAGYAQYELSNYAKAGGKCAHNMVYWLRGDYAGFGMGAASCVAECRWKNTEEMTEYLECNDPRLLRREEQELTCTEQRSEAMFLGLRLIEGIDTEMYAGRYGAEPEALYGEWIDRMKREALLEEVYTMGGRSRKLLRLTARGRDVANYVMTGFV